MRLEAHELEEIAAALAPLVAELVRAELAVDGARAVRTVAHSETLSVQRAAELVGVSVATVRRAYRSGRLRATRPAGSSRVVIREDDLREWATGDAQLVAEPARAAARRVGDQSNRRPVVTAPRRRSPAALKPGSRESLREIERACGTSSRQSPR